MVPAPQWEPAGERQEDTSSSGLLGGKPQLFYCACPVLQGNIHGLGICKFIYLLLSFSQSFTVISPPIQTIRRDCQHKRAEAQSRHPEEHPQAGQDCTVGENNPGCSTGTHCLSAIWHQLKVVEHGVW